jgi:hypothetical protein
VNISGNRLRDPGEHDQFSRDVRAGRQGCAQLLVAVPSDDRQHIAEALGLRATSSEHRQDVGLAGQRSY